MKVLSIIPGGRRAMPAATWALSLTLVAAACTPTSNRPGEAEPISGSLLLAEFGLPPDGDGLVPAYHLTRYDPAGGAAQPLWWTDSPNGMMGPRLSVAPDASTAAYWSMQVTGGSGSAAAGQAGMDDQLFVRRLEPGAPAVPVLRMSLDVEHIGGIVWSSDSDAIWFLRSVAADAASSASEPTGGPVALHRVEVRAADGQLLAGQHRVEATLDAAAMEMDVASLLAVDETAGRAAFADLRNVAAGQDLEPAAIVILDLETGQPTARIALDPTEGAATITASPTGKTVAAAAFGADGEPGTTRIVDVASGKERTEQAANGAHIVGPPIWSWDGRWVGWQTVTVAEGSGSFDGYGWQVVRIDGNRNARQAVRLPTVQSATPDGPYGQQATTGDDTLVALAPNGPAMLIRAGVVGRDDGTGGQAQGYIVLDPSDNTEVALAGLPLDEPRLTLWLPTK